MNTHFDLTKCNIVVDNIKEDLLFLLNDLYNVPNLNITAENLSKHVQDQIKAIIETHIYRDYENVIRDHENLMQDHKQQSNIVKNEKLGRVPDGYIKVYGDDGKIFVEIDPDRKELIQYIFEAHDSGTKKSHLVADLEKMGWKSPTGKKITCSTINATLNRRNIYQGGHFRAGFSFPKIL